ncbi:MAG: hypothetical protein NC350_03555 [Corallococcus sp.]|nr:hypothetical protein [Corallococcus sp.]
MSKQNNSRVSKLIVKGGTYSTTAKSKYISTPDYDKGEGFSKYIPKTQANLREIVKLKGKPDVYEDKRFGKRLIWW